MRYLICIGFFLLLGKVQSSVYYHLRFEIEQSHTASQDSFFQFHVVMQNKTVLKKDYFSVNGSEVVDKQMVFHDSFRFYFIFFILCDRKGDTLGFYEPGGGYTKQQCLGYRTDRPFSGRHCLDLSEFGYGSICGILEFNFIEDVNSDSVITSSALAEEPHTIYHCWSAQARDSALVLMAPCYFLYRNSPENISWYGREVLGGEWEKVGIGYTYYPAKLGIGRSGLFGKSWEFKAVLDSNPLIFHSYGYSSIPSLPMVYYLNAHNDSVILQKNKRCYDKNKLLFYYDSASLFQKTQPPEITVYYRTEESESEFCWFLGALVNKKTDLFGKKIIYTSGGKGPIKLPYMKGRYRVHCDFTPWQQADENFSEDTIYADENDSGYFITEFKVLQDVKCYGDTTARITLRVKEGDSARYEVSMDGWNYFDTSKIFDALGSGTHIYYIRKDSSCTYTGSGLLKSPEPAFEALRLDTTLCFGQNLHVNIKSGNLSKNFWVYMGDTVSKADTSTFSYQGKYHLLREDDTGCEQRDSIMIARIDKKIRHDFYIPSESFKTDTVFAIMSTSQKPDRWQWSVSAQGSDIFTKNKWNLAIKFPDSGNFLCSLYGRYGDCGFTRVKSIRIWDSLDSSHSDPRLGLRGNGIKSIHIFPNPNNGVDYKLKLQLRDTAAVKLQLIDGISGRVRSETIWAGSREYLDTPFSDISERPGVSFVRIQVASEYKMVKIVVSK